MSKQGPQPDKSRAESTSRPVQVLYGPCIPEGEARSEQDITLMNGRLAVTFAVATDPPWGLLRGGLLDAAVVRNGRPDPDLLSIFDFLPDNWAGWPNTFIRFQVTASGPEEASVTVQRDWGDVDLLTSYTLKQDQDRLQVRTRMSNHSRNTTRTIASGYALWPKKGFILTPPGLDKARQSETAKALSDCFIGYDLDWALALHAPFADWMDHYGKGMFRRHRLEPGQSRSLEGWLQICPSGDIASVLGFEMQRKGSKKGRLSGRVFDAEGQAVQQPVVSVAQSGSLYTWTLGRDGCYALDLPEGEYTVQSTGCGFGAAPAAQASIRPGRTQQLNFTGLSAPARLVFQIREAASGRPLDAGIRMIEGRQPEIGFLGRKTFFTELEPIGRAEISLAPGDYIFEISHGSGFCSQPQRIRMTAGPGRTETIEIKLNLEMETRGAGWYAADLHHHGNILDGATEPEEAVRSQLASGLDVLFLSDHDSTANNQRMLDLAKQRNRLFLPAMEISRSWGHFNIYPLLRDPRPDPGPVTGSPREIFQSARDMGADIICANHPFSTYGYLRNLELGSLPGEFDPDFDLLEINYQHPAEPVIQKIWECWNQGQDCYLTAGTDSHDVQSDLSGAVRMYVYLPEKANQETFLAALKAGRSFVSFGPLIFPEIMFGSRLCIAKGQRLALRFRLMAVNALFRAELIERGQVRDTRELTKDSKVVDLVFETAPERASWFALQVTDQHGKQAFSNPIWVSVEGAV